MPACPRSTTVSPRSPSRSRRTRSSPGRTSSRCATTSGMISDDHVVPVIRRKLLRRYGARAAPTAQRHLAAAVHAGAARAQPAGDRRAAARGGRRRVRRRQRARRRRATAARARGSGIGFQDVRGERDARAPLRAGRCAAPAIRVSRPRDRAAAGRPSSAMRRRRIDLWPGYSGSLLELPGRELPAQRSLKRLGARAARALPGAGPQRLRDEARRARQASGSPRLSDLKRYWPVAAASGRAPLRARAAADERQSRAVGGRARQRARPPRGVGSSADGARRHRRDRRLRRAGWITPTSRRTSGPTSTRSPATASTTTTTATSTTSTASTSSSRRARAGPQRRPRPRHARRRDRRRPHANGRGVVGVAPRAKLMIVKVLDAEGAGTTGGVAEGIRYAAANGARVINLSLSGAERDPRLIAADRGRQGAPTCCWSPPPATTASTSTASRHTRLRCPPPNLLAVASTDPDSGRDLSEFSNYGRLARAGGRARRRRSSPPPPTAAMCSRAARRWLRRSWPASPRSPPA